MIQDVYKQNGYENRQHYLECIAEDYGVDVQTVCVIADLYGPSEDFDGLVTTIQDYEEME